jgi:hypothetical protein
VLLAFAALLACEPAPRPPVVALITVDTWRFDHLSAARSPNLWALAEAGERYTQAWSPIGLTSPAHAAMLTGTSLAAHGMEANNHHGYQLDPAIPSLPSRFVGYASGAFVSAYPAGPEGGLGVGWEVFDAPESGERSGQIAVDRALAWLPTDRPSLLWVHLYEPHGPYVGAGSDDVARYAAEVARADAMLEPLIDALVERKATIVVAADHGEVLLEERCGRQHERSLHEAVLHVPLIRWAPGRSPAVIDRRLGLEDVPALLQGQDPPARAAYVVQSGLCDPNCAVGCTPAGPLGRDRAVMNAQGRWVQRPGKGTWPEGDPGAAALAELQALPPVRPPQAVGQEAEAEALGYVVPSPPPQVSP